MAVTWSWSGALGFIRPPVVCIKPGGGVILNPAYLKLTINTVQPNGAIVNPWTVSGILESTAVLPPFTFVQVTIDSPEVQTVVFFGMSPFSFAYGFTTPALDHYAKINLIVAGAVYTTAYVRVPGKVQ